MKVKYPDIYVQLTGNDGNGFLILSKVLRSMRNAGVPQEIRDEFVAEATSDDYDHLLQVVQEWVDCG